MQLGGIKRALTRACRDVLRHHTLQVSAALSFYFVLAIFPCLIFLSAVLSFIPLHLFTHIVYLMDRVLPADAMKMLTVVLNDVLSSRHGALLSFGMLGTIWVASAAFDALIEALDIAYDVEHGRPLWRSRLLAIGLAATCGALLLTALAVTVAGPRFGEWLASRFALSAVFVLIWPGLRWTIAICFTILTVEVLYFLAPNVKQRFVATLPGAVLSVAVWNILSHLLGLYFRHVANFNRTYGTLGGFVALMMWMYWASFVLLVGAELNAELAKESKEGSLEPRKSTAEEHSQDIASPPIDHAA